MALWRTGVVSAFQVAIFAMSSMSQYNCDVFSDPATRLADCLQAAVKSQSRQRTMAHASCDLKLKGRYIVVLHPAGEVSNEEVVSAGLPESLLPELRVLRQRGAPAIYVIAADRTVTGFGTDRSTASSRTTSQTTFVQINQLMILTKNTQPVTVVLGGTPAVRVIDRIR